jgi:hypothetical protein
MTIWHLSAIGPGLLTQNKGVQTAAVFLHTHFVNRIPPENEAWIQMEMRTGPIDWGGNAVAWESWPIGRLKGWVEVAWQRAMKYLCRSTGCLWTHSGQGPDNEGWHAVAIFWISNKWCYLFHRNQQKHRARVNWMGQVSVSTETWKDWHCL